MKNPKIVMVGDFDVAGGCENWRRLLKRNFEYFVVRKSNNQYEDTSSNPSRLRSSLKRADIIFYACAVKDAFDPNAVVDDSVIHGVEMAEFSEKVVVWLHGSNSLRANVEEYKADFEKYRKVVCATPDLCRLFRGGWFPNPSVLDHVKVESKKHLPLLCVQCPTDRKVKNTDEYKAVCQYLENKYPNFKGIVKTGTHEEIMQFKQEKVRIGFDNLQGYFCVNAMEFAWCGIATLASLKPEYMPYMKAFSTTWTLPFINVLDVNELKRELGRLLEYPETVEEEGRRERAWMETFWSRERHLENLYKVIEED